ncbi:MAG: hypothetical protein ACK5LP_09340 [Campylobacteraceae bacterium]
MKFLIVVFLIGLGIYFFKDSVLGVTDKAVGQVQTDYQQIPAPVKQYNEKIFGKMYFIQNSKEAQEVKAICDANNKWKSEPLTRDIFNQNCLDAAIAIQ